MVNPTRNLLCFAVLAALAGCAADRHHRDGLSLIDGGNLEDGIRKLELASREEPQNVGFRSDYLNRREELVHRLAAQAERDLAQGRLDGAERAYQRMLAFEPANSRATDGLETVRRRRRIGPVMERAKAAYADEQLDNALALASLALEEDPAFDEAQRLKRQIGEAREQRDELDPALRVSLKRTVTLDMKGATLRAVIDELGRQSGIDFLLDKDLQPDTPVSIKVREETAEEALALLLELNKLARKTIRRKRILLYGNTRQKRAEYEELIVKGFYLKSADVQRTQHMLRDVLKVKDVFIDEKINLLLLHDTPEVIAHARRLIAMQDLQEPEVMLDVEVLEINHHKDVNIGIKFPGQIALTPLGAGAQTTVADLKHFRSTTLGATMDDLLINLNTHLGDVSVLANPRIRVRNREKAKIMVGQKIPQVTTMTTPQGGTAENVQYTDIGIRLEVEPTIHLENIVAIRMDMEVSSVVDQFQSTNGTLTNTFGTRAASTTLELKDGETQILAGLINNTDRKEGWRVPGLGLIPILGDIFNNHQNTAQKTEIVLAITPHIIRNVNRPEANASQFVSGIDTTPDGTPFGPGFPGSSSPFGIGMPGQTPSSPFGAGSLGHGSSPSFGTGVPGQGPSSPFGGSPAAGAPAAGLPKSFTLGPPVQTSPMPGGMGNPLMPK